MHKEAVIELFIDDGETTIHQATGISGPAAERVLSFAHTLWLEYDCPKCVVWAYDYRWEYLR